MSLFEDNFKTLFHQHFKRLSQFSFSFVKDEDVTKRHCLEVFFKLWNLPDTSKIDAHLLMNTRR
ncbi:hypothetical protein C3K47_05120 [Solitalea longa]|uniref:RNA polymerase sigma-70 region 2 domain-containing protein n=1 Tax=Solitalea longa TaxID=2079460 RepID=A0A2S5A5N8_9SPHI|nr:hypothetical protein C3K47_05120 [Solitalea longa]